MLKTLRLVSLFLLTLPVQSRAWGPVGHKAIGMLAQNRLKPRTLKAISEILGPGVGLDRIATCADTLIYGARDCAGAFSIQASTGFGTMPWHYIDIPITANPNPSSLMDFCPNAADCVVAQIRHNALVLEDTQSPFGAKQTALMFLVHFVADVHQPLHVSDGDPHDKGGNLKTMNAIFFQGKPVNLHSLWDGATGDPKENDFRLPDAELTQRAQSLVERLETSHKTINTAAWTRGDLVGQAALESHEIGQAVIYPAYAASQGNDTLANYQARMRPIAERRIFMAGVRLAALLEEVIKPAVAPTEHQEALRASTGRILAALEANVMTFH